jgi:hypothetical protein
MDPVAPAPASTPAAAPAAPAPAPAPAPSPSPSPSPAPAPAAAPVSEPSPAAPAAAPAAEPAPSGNQFTPSLLEAGVEADTSSDPAAKPAEAPKGDAKQGEGGDAPSPEPGPADTAPVYEFTFPEGFAKENVDTERLNAFTGILGENKVPTEAAQKLFDLHTEEVGRISSQMLNQQWDVFHRQQEKAIAEVKSDPEIGGSRYLTAMRDALRTIEYFGGSAEEQRALKTDLSNTGMGNRRLLIRLLSRVGANRVREGAPVPANPPRSRPMTTSERGLLRYAGSGTPGAVPNT